MTRTAILLRLLLTTGAAAQVPPPAAPAVPDVAAPVPAPAAPASAEAAAAPMAVAAPAAPAAPAPPPLPTDRRERVEAVCMAEARTKAKAAGASDVLLREVQDTDVKSDGYASMRAKVELVSVDSKGKSKKKKGTFGCATRNDAITSLTFD